MARKPQLEPAWLVSLLNGWAARSQQESSRALGWYQICPMLQSGIPGRARSYEPTGFSQQDYTDLEAALAMLTVPKQLAILRYFKPTMKASIDYENQYTPIMWDRLFAEAFAFLAVRLDASKQYTNGRRTA